MNGPRHRGYFFKNLACTKGDQLFGSDFHTILDKMEADKLQLTKK